MYTLTNQLKLYGLHTQRIPMIITCFKLNAHVQTTYFCMLRRYVNEEDIKKETIVIEGQIVVTYTSPNPFSIQPYERSHKT